jgi:hypothetical protein
MTVDPAQAAMARDALARGESWQGELTVDEADGSTVIVSTNQVPFSEESRRLTLETHHDVTQQKLLEEALERRLVDIAGTDEPA